jgi:hypothetical protein
VNDNHSLGGLTNINLISPIFGKYQLLKFYFFKFILFMNFYIILLSFFMLRTFNF